MLVLGMYKRENNECIQHFLFLGKIIPFQGEGHLPCLKNLQIYKIFTKFSFIYTLNAIYFNSNLYDKSQ